MGSTRREIRVSGKQGSLNRLQLARNYGNYLGSKGFGGASDAPSQAEGCSPFGPGIPAWWLWILSRRDLQDSAGEEWRKGNERWKKRKEVGKEGAEKRSSVWRSFLPLAKYLSNSKLHLVKGERGGCSHFHTIPRGLWFSLSGFGSPPDPPHLHNNHCPLQRGLQGEGPEEVRGEEKRWRRLDENYAWRWWRKGIRWRSWEKGEGGNNIKGGQ